jgi:plastocyanin
MFNHIKLKITSNKNKANIFGICGLLAITPILFYANASAESVPVWVQNTALWYGQGNISETEFINAIKFLLENKIIILDDVTPKTVTNAKIIIPNGNSDIQHIGFYSPLNLEITKGTIVTWINDDAVLHTIQSIDEQGNIIGLFNSPPLNTGEQFAHKFDESGTYNYYCSLHPWRVGIVTVR